MAGRSSARPERIIVLSELAVSTVALRLLWNPKHWGLALRLDGGPVCVRPGNGASLRTGRPVLPPIDGGLAVI